MGLMDFRWWLFFICTLIYVNRSDLYQRLSLPEWRRIVRILLRIAVSNMPTFNWCMFTYIHRCTYMYVHNMLNFKVEMSLYTYQWICLPEYWIVVIVRWHIQSIPIRIVCTVVYGQDELNDRSLFIFTVPSFGMLGCHMPKWMFLYPCLDDHLDCLVTGVLWGVSLWCPCNKKSPEMK